QHNHESRLIMTSGHLGNYTTLTDATWSFLSAKISNARVRALAEHKHAASSSGRQPGGLGKSFWEMQD
ncbi:hypothetical protein, partial [Pseudothioclava nitratireducens]|uniref:hypothetical protein n=1 Tax=Pseudothioclava nitratireducens TaxID=1928646 RepID=UPI0023DA82A8